MCAWVSCLFVCVVVCVSECACSLTRYIACLYVTLFDDLLARPPINTFACLLVRVLVWLYVCASVCWFVFCVRLIVCLGACLCVLVAVIGFKRVLAFVCLCVRAFVCLVVRLTNKLVRLRSCMSDCWCVCVFVCLVGCQVFE